ncbi:MAG: hypothetical protein ACTSQF_09230 [Candidatus Heimdallarchaeaceae archaeon]
MKMETSFCFRVDIDTWEGLHKGIPECLSLSKKNSFPFTYYLSLGKYATGRNLFRIVKNKEPIRRNIPVWQRNHWKDLFRGIFLPPKKIGTNTIKILKEYQANEHTEFHSHGYNHVQWANSFNRFSEDETSSYLDLMKTEFTKIFGKGPLANAAPNFKVNPFYLSLLSSKQFKFASDFVHHSPFLLSSSDTSKNTEESIVQLPVTEETIESLVMLGKSRSEIIEFYKQRFQNQIDNGISYVCLYIHAVYEPLKLYSVIEDIIKLTEQYDMKPLTHLEYYNQRKQYPTIKINNLLPEI